MKFPTLTLTNFKNIISKTPEKLSLATNYHKLSLLSRLVRP